MLFGVSQLVLEHIDWVVLGSVNVDLFLAESSVGPPDACSSYSKELLEGVSPTAISINVDVSRGCPVAPIRQSLVWRGLIRFQGSEALPCIKGLIP